MFEAQRGGDRMRKGPEIGRTEQCPEGRGRGQLGRLRVAGGLGNGVLVPEL